MKIARLPLSVLALATLVGVSSLALADEPRATPVPKPEGGPATVFTFARENPDCSEWTNACQVCTRKAEGGFHCSTPGIACQPGPPVCSVKKAP